MHKSILIILIIKNKDVPIKALSTHLAAYLHTLIYQGKKNNIDISTI